MRERSFIHVAGPPGSGKTMFVQTILAAYRRPILVARCVRNDGLKRARESRLRNHPELQRYLQSGASDAALFAFASEELSSVEFYETDLMLNYSEAVLLEGENPAFYADLEVFVAPAPALGEPLYVRRQRDVAAARRATLARWEALLQKPDGAATWMDQVMGMPVTELRKYPSALEAGRSTLLAGIAAARAAPPPQPVEHWAVSERFGGIEAAGLVIVNVRDKSERASAERLVDDVHRLRKEPMLYEDILGRRGSRLPVTAVVANLAESGDAGRAKALARVRRTMRRTGRTRSSSA